MSAIVVSVHGVVGASSAGAGRVAGPSPSGTGMDYRIAWAANETMDRLFQNICLLGPFANTRRIDSLNIHGSALAGRFLTECRTVPGERSLRGITHRCLKLQHSIHLIVENAMFQTLMRGGSDFQTYIQIFRSTGAQVYFGSRRGQQFAFTH